MYKISRNFNPEALPLAKDSKMINLERSKCAEAATWPPMINRNCKAMDPSLVPKPNHTIPVILNHQNNDPYNRPSIIKVMIVPEDFMPEIMDLDYRYAIKNNGSLSYKTRIMEVKRKDFDLPTEENDFRFGIDPKEFQYFQDCLAKLKKADKQAFNKLEYKWAKTEPLFDGCKWNQFALDAILHRHSANEVHALTSYR